MNGNITNLVSRLNAYTHSQETGNASNDSIKKNSAPLTLESDVTPFSLLVRALGFAVWLADEFPRTRNAHGP